MACEPAPYFTVARRAEAEEVAKGSRFLARVARAASVAEALAFTEEVRARDPGATHHAWAYLVGADYRFSDDGEPAGTAGRPMLEVLQRRGLDRVVGVVTRTYGGTKLGAGGLVRAYGGTFAKALDLAGSEEVRPRTRLALHLPFACMDAAHRLLDAWPGLEKSAPDFDGEGMRLRLELPREGVEPLKTRLAELSRGGARFTGGTGPESAGDEGEAQT